MSNGKNVVKFPDLASAETEAAEWVVKLEAGCSSEEFARFQEWQDRSPVNREAVQRLSALWSQFDVLANYAVPLPRAAAKRARWDLPPWLVSDVTDIRRRPVGYAAAALLLIMTITVGVYLMPSQHSSPTPVVYQAAVGTQRNISLPDGTAVTLNSGSQVEVAYSPKGRDLNLVRGEAYFVVAHADARPFTVHAGDRKVHDIGTAFDVRLTHSAVEVIVTKGAVELLAPARSDAVPGERLSVVLAGQHAAFDHRLEYLQSISDTEINRMLSWRDGVVVYAGDPLSRVIEDVRRYSNIQIELADPRLKDVPVGGYFEINKIRGVFGALDANFGIHATWLDATHVRLAASRPVAAKSSPR